LSLESQARSHVNDPGAELLDRISSLWSRHGRYLLAGLGVIVAAGAIGYFTLQTRARTEEQAAAKLAEGNIFFWQGEYQRSRDIAKQVNEQFANTSSGVDALRIGGDAAFWMGDFKAAADGYKLYLDKNPRGSVANAVRRSYAYALESSGQLAAAATVFESVVGVFDRESSAEFLSGAARCYRELNQPAEARKRLQRLLDEYGETSYAQIARVHIGELSAAK
jgi:tetratricopeptide (TPR) repeat protein